MFEVIHFFKRKIYPGFKIGKSDMVIDIGSGDKPFWRADVFFDDLSLNNNQRISGKGTIHNIGTFVDGNILRSPFKNKAFDFSFASHLLEHVERPDLAINEIVRISKRGYLEVPSYLLECISPFHSHLWYVVEENRKLFFLRKSKQMHRISLKNEKNYKYLFKKISNPFIRIYWEKNIAYEVISDIKQGEEFIASKRQDGKTKKFSISFYIIFVKIMRLIFLSYKNTMVDMRKLTKK